MASDPALFALSAAGLSIPLLLLAAKAHGRQVRLRRELEGYDEVTFTGDNPPWVEELWRRDRRRFWSVFPSAAIAMSLYLVLAFVYGWPRGNLAAEGGLPIWAAVLVLSLLWAPALGLTMSGLSHLLELNRALNRSEGGERRVDLVRRERGAWLRSATRGSFGYWTAVLALLALVLSLAVV